jgi:hypothetical protein
VSNRPQLSVDEIIALCQQLTLTEQQQVKESLQRKYRAAMRTQESPNWETLEEAADSLGKSKSQVSRDAKNGKLRTNGQKGGYLRVLTWSVAEAHFSLALRFFKKGIRQHRREWPNENRNLYEFEDRFVEMQERFGELLKAVVLAGGAGKETRSCVIEIAESIASLSEMYINKGKRDGWLE